MIGPTPARRALSLKRGQEMFRPMAIKVQKQTETEVTETEVTETPVTSALAPFAAANLFAIEPPKPVAGNLLPQVKIPYPVEMCDKFPASTLYKVGLFDGNKFDPIAAPFILTVVACRDASRKLVVKDVDGKKEKAYERAYRALGPGFDKSATLFAQHQTDPEADKGVSYIVAVVDGAGKVAVAELPAFKVLKDYWGRPLYQARFANGLGLKVKIEDHSANLTQSKKDATVRYLAPNKFTQHEVVELTPDQLQCIAAVRDGAKDKFKAWAEQ